MVGKDSSFKKWRTCCLGKKWILTFKPHIIINSRSGKDLIVKMKLKLQEENVEELFKNTGGGGLRLTELRISTRKVECIQVHSNRFLHKGNVKVK